MAKTRTAPAGLASAAAARPHRSNRVDNSLTWIDEDLRAFDWGRFRGPAVVPEHLGPLLDAGVRGWVCFELLGEVGAPYSSLNLAVAIGAADALIIAPMSRA